MSRYGARYRIGAQINEHSKYVRSLIETLDNLDQKVILHLMDMSSSVDMIFDSKYNCKIGSYECVELYQMYCALFSIV